MYGENLQSNGVMGKTYIATLVSQLYDAYENSACMFQRYANELYFDVSHKSGHTELYNKFVLTNWTMHVQPYIEMGQKMACDRALF